MDPYKQLLCQLLGLDPEAATDDQIKSAMTAFAAKVKAGQEGNGAVSRLTDAKLALLAMAVEADELKRVVGGSVTEAVAGWLAPQYALAAQQQLVELKGANRFELLRAFVKDWALLRHGDHAAERLRIEREWLAVTSRHADMKWKRKIIVGLETLKVYVNKHPEAKAAMDELARQVRHPFDPTESD